MPFGDLQHRLVEGGAGPRRLHHHRAKGERRILVAAETEESEAAGEHGGEHEVDDERAALDRPLREIGADHDAAPSRRTFWPGRSAWTPAVTTISPASSPCATTTLTGLWRATSILRSATVAVAGSTTQTAG